MRRTFASVATAAAMFTTFLSAAAAQAAVSPPWDPFFAAPSTALNLASLPPAAAAGANTTAFGLAVGYFDGDSKADIVAGRGDGQVYFAKGNADGTFVTPGGPLVGKLVSVNARALASGDLNGDSKLDLIWGANAAAAPTADGDVRVWLGNGDGTFVNATGFLNHGTLLGNIGIDAGSLAIGDVDGDGDQDVIAGAIEGTNSVIKLLRNDGLFPFTESTLISQASACASPCSPIYFPATSLQNSPWGISLSDADGDTDRDLWITDRALYTYLYRNDGTGTFALQGSNSAVSGRPNVYLGHDSSRAAVGFTGSAASADVNGDGKADHVLGVHSGNQTPTTGCGSPSGPCPHDGKVLLDVSDGFGHVGFGSIADVGTQARSVALSDVNGDTFLDVISGSYEGQVKVLRQLPPLDSDSDGLSDYLDNAPTHANAPRLDMNTDGLINHLDQLDNDFDTVLGNPEDQSTWQRRGDPADGDDDNDGIDDTSDNCPFAANAPQADDDEDVGADTFGNACDPLDSRDPDGDGVPTGALPGDALYEEASAASAKWSRGETHFVLRIDALGRIFQNEFTQLMTDAATLSPAEWETKCWENYGPVGTAVGPADPADPCGTDEGGASQDVTLPGGMETPVTLVTIPRLLWTDEPIIQWINDRNDNPRFELGQHGTYHASNTTKGDWADDADRFFYSCEFCGFTEAESLELLAVGRDILLGSYGNAWVSHSGATASSAKIDWLSSANPLLSYAPPFNTDDPAARRALAQLGFMAHSSSVHEEENAFFTPEGAHLDQHDDGGLFHAPADVELEPPDTPGDTYDSAAYETYLQGNVEEGGLTTWLIEEVEWSGRPCNTEPRVTDGFQDAPALCTADPNDTNRENNTVYMPRWNAWIQLLDFVRDYPGGVAMTMGEVALAKSFDNAPTVPNGDQADADHDGIGDVIDGASFGAQNATITRNQPGALRATLTNGDGDPIAEQTVDFSFDADGDGTEETYTDTTDASGLAEVSVTPSRPVGDTYSFSVEWDGVRASHQASASVTVADTTTVELDAMPTSGQITDQVTVGATLRDSDDAPLEGLLIEFSIGSATGSGTTDPAGHATASLTLAGPAGSQTLTASFEGQGLRGPSSDSTAFSVNREDTALSLSDAVATKNGSAIATATLTQDAGGLLGKTVEFFVQDKVKNQTVYTSIGTAETNASGVATKEIPTRYVSKTARPIRATFPGDAEFLTSTGNASAYRA